MKMTPEEFKAEYWDIYQDVWKFHKETPIPENDEEWDAVIAESGRITAKHGGRQFLRNLLIAVLDEMEERGKKDV